MATYWGTSADETIRPWGVSPSVTSDGASTPQDNVYDHLYGWGSEDILDGGLGADYMDGGDGHDTYIVNSTSDQISEQWDDELAGVDQVFSTVSYTLPSMIETSI